MQKHHFYLPIELDLDVTGIEEFFSNQGQKIPATALMVKAAALLQKKVPYSHRIVFPTLFGPRLLQMSEPIVNLPIVVKENDQEILSAITIEKADQKTLKELSVEIKAAINKPASAYPIVHFVHRKKNHFLNRFLLRILYFMAYCVPQNYMRRRGGGICVSSLYNNHSAEFHMRPYAFGPTALTLCFSSLKKNEGKTILKVGVGYDHTAFSGNEMTKALNELTKILQVLANEIDKPRGLSDIS